MKPFPTLSEPALFLLKQLDSMPTHEREVLDSPELQELIDKRCVVKIESVGTSTNRYRIEITPLGKSFVYEAKSPVIETLRRT
jgi:hypothetical protein